MANLKKTAIIDKTKGILYIGLGADNKPVDGFGANELPKDTKFVITWMELTKSLRDCVLKSK